MLKDKKNHLTQLYVSWERIGAQIVHDQQGLAIQRSRNKEQKVHSFGTIPHARVYSGIHWCKQWFKFFVTKVPSGHEDSVPHQTVTGNLFKKVRNGGVITGVVKTIEPFYYMTSCRKEGALYTTISILYSSHDCCKCSLSHPLSFPRLLQVFSWISTWNSNLIKIKSKNLRSVLPCKSLVI